MADNGDAVGSHEPSFESVQDTGSGQDDMQLLVQGLDAVSLPMHLIDKDYRITFINQAAADLLGMKKEQAIGRKCHELYKTANCNTHECPCRVAMEKNTTYRCDNTCGDLIIDCTGAPLKDEYGMIIGAIEYFPDVTGQKNAVKDILRVAGEAEKGNLSARTDLALHEGDFLEMAKGINTILDAVIGPLNVAADYVDRFSNGDVPEKITDEYHGDFNVIKNNLNQCIDGLQGLVEANRSLQRMAVNDHTLRMTGKYRGVFAEVATAVNAVQDRVNHVAGSIDKISHGDLSELEEYRQVKRRSEQDRIVPGFIRTLEALQGLTSDANMLAKAGVEGRLQTRADASKHEGEYRTIVAGVNDTLDAVIGPLNVAADYVDRISNGNIPPKITDSYNGDFNAIKNNLNACIDAVNLLVADANMLAKAGVEGRLNTRADASKHKGDFAKIVEGVNDTLDAVIGPLNIAADFIGDVAMGKDIEKITGEYHGDYARIKDSINKCHEVLYGLLGEVATLTQAAVNGKLEIRGNVEKFDGAWTQLVGGVNDTLDAVVGPINEAMRVSEAYADGNFAARVDEKLHVAGDFIAFKEALNNIGIQVSKTVLEINRAIEQVEEGTNEASKGSDEIAKAAEQVAITSQRCADLSKQLLGQIETIDRQVADLSASNEEIASTSQDVLDRARNAAQRGQEAQKLGQDAKNKMSLVERIAEQSVAEIEQLNGQMREINNIVKLITDIANQVNLLALNAAIEAARAGEHGRGFAVVAGEVRNLAGEAKSATGHIEKAIGGIQVSSEKTAAAIKSAHDEIGSGVASVNNAIESLDGIITEAEVVAHGIGEIAKATEDQANVTNQVGQGMAEGTKVTKENQAQVEDLAALAEEASASTEEIGSAAHELNAMARSLKQTMGKFRV
ncbi:PAS domain-containing protein [Methanoculleus sp. FWC-SCC1]|uniref:PAS domain-containing protein n=1 Tax=Methanoculleus frigidifontis TaxID=2584085 RepID=A0ABT8M7I4_9EURY|nr:methyl-accepting chemotaxis protein [Methanoculleus sp. FWC-SCC1]MDN7023886.1 PAS domain-containing protein [Methanoculleus sp. FWC-SCC1]